MRIRQDNRAPRQQLRLGDRAILCALHLNSWLRGYTIAPAVTEMDWAAHTRLVQSTFFEIGYFSDPQTPMQKMPRESISHVWVARFRGQPVGTVRLVQDPHQFPVERRLNVRWPDRMCRSHVGELGRFAIASVHRRRRFAVTYVLLATAFRHSLRCGIRWWVGCAAMPLLASIRQHAPHLQLLDTLPMQAEQLAAQKGREAYFSAKQAICPFLLDLHRVSVLPIANDIVRKRVQNRTLMRYKKPAA